LNLFKKAHIRYNYVFNDSDLGVEPLVDLIDTYFYKRKGSEKCFMVVVPENYIPDLKKLSMLTGDNNL